VTTPPSSRHGRWHASSRLALAHVPTPLVHLERVSEATRRDGETATWLEDRGVSIWVKRDDMTGGVEAGNKIRKLEFLLADAREKGADTLVTCGGIQSNHARATAALGARLGLATRLLLRTTDAELDVTKVPPTGNLLLDRMFGAEVRLITPAQYRERNALMREVSGELERAGRRPYVIPEGGSNGLGSLGYVEAMREIRAQLDAAKAPPFDLVVFACGSGGTAAGVALGASRFGVTGEVRPMAVCDDRRTFEDVIDRIVTEARALEPTLGDPANVVVDDGAKGPAYGVATRAQRELIVSVARRTGLVLDPVYTGKAFAGLCDLARTGELDHKRVLFLHTGGLPGLLAQAGDVAEAL
jgi:D-cysteine desulfhydrase